MKKLFLLLLTTFIISCSTDDSSNNPVLKLPPETQTGANTFGCIIDGKILIPRSGNTSQVTPLSGARLFGGYPDVYDYFELKILDYKTPKNSSFLFHLHNIVANGLGTYSIDKSNGMRSIDGLSNNYIHCNVFVNKTNSYQQYVSYQNSGAYTINRLTLSTGSGAIISGTFNCKLRNINDPTDEIEITDGRFDINSLTVALTYFP
jgi:hypothetical protein